MQSSLFARKCPGRAHFILVYLEHTIGNCEVRREDPTAKSTGNPYSVRRGSCYRLRDPRVEGNNPRTPIWNSPRHEKHISTCSSRPSRIATYRAVILSAGSRYAPAKFPKNVLLQNSIDHLPYRMRPDIDAPLEPPHRVVNDARSQMTFRLERISPLRTWGGSARALALGDRVRSMVHVRHRSEGVTTGDGYFGWDRDTEPS